MSDFQRVELVMATAGTPFLVLAVAYFLTFVALMVGSYWFKPRWLAVCAGVWFVVMGILPALLTLLSLFAHVFKHTKG